ncbi:hypothetical protein GCM10022255_044770 [Dactylosporangium darangshiense]|uniref:Transposase IS116/IS110/IS902 C-terminal domain-containing protein n=1 Tax=Dactylosporangium darangshiense TaxID=579108 RepID=A0ABP8DBA0_9ACTN
MAGIEVVSLPAGGRVHSRTPPHHPPPERVARNHRTADLRTIPCNDAYRWKRLYTSLPGLGVVLGARVLAEFGDDPKRYADAKARKNYAGTSPITRASGTKTAVLARHLHNDRLADAVHQWALGALRGSPGARAYYDAMRARKIGHHAALRQLGNRLVGILHGCLKTRTAYDENTAGAHLNTAAA